MINIWDDDLILAEIASTVVGIQMLNYQREEDEKNIRRRTAVNMAVNTLSYSELRAVSAILSELKGNEDSWLLLSSRIVLALPALWLSMHSEVESTGIMKAVLLEWREPISKCWFQISLKKLRKEITKPKPWFQLTTLSIS